MFRPRDAWFFAIATGAALLLTQDAADARGGHSRGHVRGGAGRIMAPSVTPAAALVGLPSAAATPTASASKSGAKPVSGPAPVNPLPTTPTPTPASVVGTPAPQGQPIAPLSPP